VFVHCRDPIDRRTADATQVRLALTAALVAVAAIAVPAALAFVAGLVIVRLPALAFSMLTLAVAQSFHEIFLRWRQLANGDDGTRFLETLGDPPEAEPTLPILETPT